MHDGRGEFTEIELDGRIGDRSYRLDFRTEDGRYDSERQEMDSTRNGLGTFGYRPRPADTRFRKLSVKLKDNNQFEIRASDGVTEVYHGRWWSTSSRQIRLDLDRVGWKSASGGGSVFADGRGSFVSVSLDGKFGDRRFELNFSAGRDDNSGFDNDYYSEFRGKAHLAIRDKFPNGGDFEWFNVTVSDVAFGNRTIKGEFRVRNVGSRDGRYRYSVVAGAGTGRIISINYSRV